MNLFKLAPVALLTLGACDTAAPETTTDSSLAIEAAAPPGAGGLTLEIDGILEPGLPITFRVSGAAANASVYLVRGAAEQAGALCPAPLGGLCVDVTRAQIITTLRANGQGVATLTTNVPNLPDMTQVFFQAATGGAGAATSAVIPKWNPVPDQQGEARLFLANLATVSPGNYTGTQIEQYYSNAAPDMDVCTIVWDVTGTGVAPLAPCPSCDFVFNVTHANPTEATTSGDCLGLMDIDVPTIAAYQGGRGYDQDYLYNGAPIAAMVIYDTTTGAWVAGANAQFNNPNFLWAVDLPQPGYIYVY